MIPLSHLILLSGCGSTPTKIKLEKVLPPAHLLLDCNVSKIELLTTKDLINLRSLLYKDLESCNHDKQLLREWSNNDK